MSKVRGYRTTVPPPDNRLPRPRDEREKAPMKPLLTVRYPTSPREGCVNLYRSLLRPI